MQQKNSLMENVPGILSKKLPDGRKVMDVLLDFIKNADWDEYYRLKTELDVEI